jgi:hypothetical protein
MDYLEPNARPTNSLTPKNTKAVLSETGQFIEQGWLEPSTSSWNAAVLYVPKPDGSVRFCVDYRFPSTVTVKGKGPLPHIPTLLDKMNCANMFSALDLCSGFYQIPPAPES